MMILTDGEVTNILPKVYPESKRKSVYVVSDKSANQLPRQRRDVISAPARLLGDDDATTSYAFNSSDKIPVDNNVLNKI